MLFATSFMLINKNYSTQLGLGAVTVNLGHANKKAAAIVAVSLVSSDFSNTVHLISLIPNIK
jgi:hypothetical protein